jgi:hypothetical protein
MNVAVVVILVVVAALVLLVVLPRIRRLSTSERTTVDRRSGRDRRRDRTRVPIERRRRPRRAEDAAREFVSSLESNS